MDDILLNEAFDLDIKNGDFVLGDSTAQNQQLLLVTEKGGFRQHPTVGVGITTFLNDEETGDLLREIRIQFSKDGMNVKQLGFEGGKLIIEAPYK